MATYIYHCNPCDKDFEVERPMADDVSIHHCLDCNNDCKQVIQVSKIIPENPWKKA